MLNRHRILLVLSIMVAHQKGYSSHLEVKQTSNFLEDPQGSEFVDLLQNHILTFFSFPVHIKTLSVVSKNFYTIVTGCDSSSYDLSIRQKNYTIKKYGCFIKDIIKTKQNLLQSILIKQYEPNRIPKWIWPEIREAKNMHPSWWPYIKDTCAHAFTVAKMPIITEVLKDPGAKTDVEELERWTQMLQKSGDIPTFHYAFQGGILLGNWFELLSKLDPFLAGQISNYVGDEKIIELGDFLKESCMETVTFSGLHIGEEALKQFMLHVQGSKITKIILGYFPIVSISTRIYLKQYYPNIEWHFDDGSIGSSSWLWNK